MFLLSAGFAFVAIYRQAELDEGRELAATGVQTRAVVTGMRVTGKRGSTHNLSYRFRGGERDAGGADRRIYRARYNELEVGDEIPVRFDPANPHRNITAPELEELERWSDRLGYSFMSLLFLAWSVAHMRPGPGEKTARVVKETRKPRKSGGRRK